MRKFVLVSALLLASVSAQAGENRSLSLAGLPTVTSTAAAEASRPIAQVAVRLAQAATTANDAAPVQVQAPAAAPVQVLAQAPAATQTTAPAPAPATTATTTATDTKSATATESKPKAVKKVRRETDEQKARRIAAKYGVYW